MSAPLVRPIRRANPDRSRGMSNNPKRQTTRNQFLSLATIGMGGTIAAVIGVPAVAYLGAPVLDKATFRPVPLGEVSEFTAQQGFPPKAAPYVEDPAEPQTSAGLAYVLTTGGKSRHWLDHDAMSPSGMATNVSSASCSSSASRMSGHASETTCSMASAWVLALPLIGPSWLLAWRCWAASPSRLAQY